MRCSTASLLPRLIAVALLGLVVAPTTAWAQDDDEPVVLAEDAFDDADGGVLFEAEEADEYQFAYDDGKYVIEAFPDDYSGELTASLEEAYEDATIAVDARLRGDELTGRYVVVGCRSENGVGGYELEIAPDQGSFTLWRGAGGDMSVLETDFHDAVRPGTRTNRIELSCLGETIAARINDEEVASISDDRFGTGNLYVGAGVYGGDAGSFEAVFDDLLVTGPADQDRESEESARENAEALDELRAEAQDGASLYGPEAGELEHLSETIGSLNTNLDIRDFYATVRFTSPYAASRHGWDVGIGFRQTESNTEYRLILTADGRWRLTVGAGVAIASGAVDGLDDSRNGEHLLELVAVDDVGYVAVNGDYVTALDLSGRTIAGDIWIGTGFYVDNAVVGEATGYADFEIWGLGDDAVQGPDEDEPDEDEENEIPRIDDDEEPADDEEDPGDNEIPAIDDEAPADDDDAATPEAGAVVALEAQNDSEVGGIVTLAAIGDQTEIALIVFGASEGAFVAIQEGRCDDLDPAVAFDIGPTSLSGTALETLDVRLDDLLAEPHAVTVHEDEDDLTAPLACGDIIGV